MLEKREQPYLSKLSYFSAIVIGVFSLLILRFWYLQGIKGDHFHWLSTNNRTRKIKTIAPRGRIYDSNYRLIVGNRPSFNVGLILEDIKDVDKTLEILAKVIGNSFGDLSQRLSEQLNEKRPFELKTILRDVDWQTVAKIKANSYRLPGVIIDANPVRSYPYGSMASQIFGYARQISKQQYQLLKTKDYDRSDLYGQAGLEKQFETTLRGFSGSEIVEVDAVGTRKGSMGSEDYKAGQDIYLTLDLDIQLIAENMLRDKRGVVVAMNPQNGEIFAMASSPSLDGNLFSRVINQKLWKRISTDKSKPLSNRALSFTYPPGSTFKLITAVAGLSEGVVDGTEKVNCPGYYKFAGRKYRCHKRSGHGEVNLREAITMSCNAFFYKMGYELGVDRIGQYASEFGFGRTTGIELPGEITGVLPSKKWKKKRFGEKWYPGDTIPVSIGQGYVTVTPLQLTVAISSLVNGGNLYKPYLVKRIIDPLTGKKHDFKPELMSKLSIDPKYLEAVKNYSIDVVNSEKGTASRARLKGILVGGKTGTAQVAAMHRTSKDNEDLKDHALFVSFAPKNTPSIVVVVIIENGGHGGVAAAPISKEVMAKYFEKHRSGQAIEFDEDS